MVERAEAASRIHGAERGADRDFPQGGGIVGGHEPVIRRVQEVDDRSDPLPREIRQQVDRRMAVHIVPFVTGDKTLAQVETTLRRIQEDDVPMRILGIEPGEQLVLGALVVIDDPFDKGNRGAGRRLVHPASGQDRKQEQEGQQELEFHLHEHKGKKKYVYLEKARPKSP